LKGKGSIPKRPKVAATVKSTTHVGRGEKPEWFVQKMKSGHIGVFHRERIGDSRLQRIKEEYRPAAPQMLGNKDVLEFIERRAYERLDRELRRQVNYLFGGGR
jgi:hypothetical protein